MSARLLLEVIGIPELFVSDDDKTGKIIRVATINRGAMHAQDYYVVRWQDGQVSLADVDAPDFELYLTEEQAKSRGGFLEKAA